MSTSTRANDGEFGIAVQGSEGSGGTNPTYAHDLYSGLAKPVRTENQIETASTDRLRPGVWASEQHWEADPTFPGHPKATGGYLLAFFGAVSTTGSTNYTHTFVEGTATPGFVTAFNHRPGGPLYEKFVDGTIDRLAFAFTAGDVLRVNAHMMGYTSNTGASAYTAVNTEIFRSAGPVFTLIGATLKLDADATPATTTVTTIRSGTVEFTRALELEQTTAFTPSVRDLGDFGGGVSLEIKWTSWALYRNFFFGSATGTTDSNAAVTGAADFLFQVGPTTDANKTLEITIPAIRLAVPDPADVDPSGGPVVLNVSGVIVPPTSGAAATVVLKNAVSSVSSGT